MDDPLRNDDSLSHRVATEAGNMAVGEEIEMQLNANDEVDENGEVHADEATEIANDAVEQHEGDIRDDADDMPENPRTVKERDGRPGDQEEEEEEVRRARMMPSPIVVSRQEREEHEVTHLPYRSWCPHCVRGRGRNTPHLVRREAHIGDVPRVSLDYFFLTEKDKEAGTNPMLVMVDEQSGEKYARVVNHKGLKDQANDGWIVADIIEELRTWGHAGGDGGHLIIKSDGESSIRLIVETVAKTMGGRVILEKRPRLSRRAMDV